MRVRSTQSAPGLARAGAALAAAVLLASCGNDIPVNAEGPNTEPGSPVTGETRLTVIDVISFTREDPIGVAPGFDIDDKVSPPGDDASCGHGDFTSPDGEPGVDNQLALITPLFDTVGIGAVEGFVQAAVEEGGLLIMWHVEGIDDLVNDPEVTVTLRFGQGNPLLGTDGVLLSGQTFHPDPESPNLTIPSARIEDGVLITGSFHAGLPIVVFEVLYILDMMDARMRAELTYDGGLTNGVLGGRVSIANLMEIAERAELESGGIIDAVTLILGGMGDMSPDEDGECQDLSAALTFSAVSAFLYSDTPTLEEDRE